MAWTGKFVTIFCDDLTERGSVKQGKVVEETASYLILETQGNTIGLPWARIIRVEERK